MELFGGGRENGFAESEVIAACGTGTAVGDIVLDNGALAFGFCEVICGLLVGWKRSAAV